MASSPLVFVFFDAWTLLTGRHPGMIERILGQGFELVDYEFKTLSEADAEEIYRINHPIREQNSWHVARLIYPMGRSLGLLFAVIDPSGCACARMQGLKGKANPALNRPGQLRHDFLAPNRCLSLMHSSDSLEHVRREGAVFFSTERLERAYVTARERASSSSGMLADLRNANAELGIERVEEPGLGSLFARVRLRLLKELERSCPALMSAAAPLVSLRGIWESLGRDASRGPVIAEAKLYLQLVVREQPLLEGLHAAVTSVERDRGGPCEYYRPRLHEPGAILSCLQVLNNPKAYSHWDSSAQLPRDLLHDRWEELLFRTHLFNFDDMLSAAEGVA
jgi:nucleoside diphosphate kinase